MIQETSTNYSNIVVKPYDAEESVTMIENQNNNNQISLMKDKKDKLLKPFETHNNDIAKPDSST